jgi:hypothetical protein
LGLELLVAILVGSAVLTGSLLFLPVVLELVHPRDAGPRLIDGGDSLGLVCMLNLEEEPLSTAGLNIDLFGCLKGLYSLEV